MRHFGLTGNIASGKSAVAKLLAEHGAEIIDADLLARDAIAPGSAGYAQLVSHFGRAVLLDDGTVNRRVLRERVFANADERAALNAIVHPIVGALREARLADARARQIPVVVSDIPLLFEVGLEHSFDGVILVDAPPSIRLERLVRDRGLSAHDAQAMMDAQWPSDRKRHGSTWVIDNDGSRAQLARRVASVWAEMLHARPAH